MKLKVTHGASAWRSKRCRCDVCRLASAALAAAGQKSRVERLKADPSLAPHGSYTTFTNWGCRCEPCTAAKAARWAEYMATPSRMTAVRLVGSQP